MTHDSRHAYERVGLSKDSGRGGLLNAMIIRSIQFGPLMLLLSGVWVVGIYLYTLPSPTRREVSAPDASLYTSSRLGGEISTQQRLSVSRNVANVGASALNTSATNNSLCFESGREEPSEEYDLIRRKLKTIVREHGFYLSSKLNAPVEKNSVESFTSDIANIIRLNNDYQRALMSELEELQKNDGYETWREREAAELSDLVQRRLHFLQNPKNCSTARKIICSLHKPGCGFGCLLHRTVNCLMVAYRTRRTMVFDSRKWGYHTDGWEAVYLPLSNTCLDSHGTSYSRWPRERDTQVVDHSSMSMRKPSPIYPPFTVPADLAPRLNRLHGLPFAWWVGQMLKYILRPQKPIAKLLEESARTIGFKRPIVGVHIRRTDKFLEAKYFRVEEYMAVVEEYYNVLELTQEVSKRRVYLATDEPKVISETQEKYPHYEIIADFVTANTASNLRSRYNENALNGLLMDIHFLSSCDYLVCTFSSNLCRLVYEIMQTYHPDAADKIRSLDSIYVLHMKNEPHNHVAVFPHDKQDIGEINLKKGDIIDVYKNNWNGFSKGRNTRSKEIGTFPSFKVTHKVEAEKFPTYPEVS